MIIVKRGQLGHIVWWFLTLTGGKVEVLIYSYQVLLTFGFTFIALNGTTNCLFIYTEFTEVRALYLTLIQYPAKFGISSKNFRRGVQRTSEGIEQEFRYYIIFSESASVLFLIWGKIFKFHNMKRGWPNSWIGSPYLSFYIMVKSKIWLFCNG